MLTTSRDAVRVNAAIDRMAAGLSSWNPPLASSGSSLLGDETTEIPALPLAAYAAGFAGIVRGEYREAIASLRRAAAAANDERALLSTAGRMAQEGRDEEAARALRSLLVAFPQSGIAHWWLGRVYENLKQSSDAHREYEAALSVALSGRASLYAAIGRTSRAEGNFARAVEAYEQRVRLTPRDPLGHKYLGWIYLEQGRRNEAFAEYETARRLDPADGEAHAGSGRILLDMGRAADAVAALSRALELLPGQYEARYALAQALQQVGQPDAAARQMELYERALEQSVAERRRQFEAGAAQRESAVGR